MTKLNLILIGIIVVILSIGIPVLNNAIEKAKKAESNLSVKEDNWKDEKGRYISEIDEITVSKSKMKDIFRQDSSRLRSSYEKIIYSLKEDLDALNVKYKDLLSKTGGILVVKDTFITRFIKKDTTLIANHNDGYLNQNFRLNKDFSMESDYTYSDSISVLEIRKPKLKDNGKKHFPNWGNLPWVGWDKKWLWYSNNPKAKYIGTYMIKIDK